MDRTRFTPGPWRSPVWIQEGAEIGEAKRLGLPLTPAMGNSGERYVLGGEKGIALVNPTIRPKRGKGFGHDDAERDANAALIAAAPELYAALDRVLDIFHRRAMSMAEADAVNLAGAALAKARGDA